MIEKLLEVIKTKKLEISIFWRIVVIENTFIMYCKNGRYLYIASYENELASFFVYEERMKMFNINGAKVKNTYSSLAEFAEEFKNEFLSKQRSTQDSPDFA